MLQAKDIMTKTVTTVGPQQTLLNAMQVLVCKQISGLPVVDKDEKIVGVITEKDILNFVFSGNLGNTTVGDVMTKEVVGFSPDDNIDTIALSIGQHRFRWVPIIEADRVVGVVSRRDILRAMLDIHCKI
jgi:CBS domain-containing protein